MELKERIEKAKTKARQMDIAGCLFSESDLLDLLETAMRDAVGEYALYLERIMTSPSEKSKCAGMWVDDYFNSLNLF